MVTWEKQQKRRTPSFSSSLLDAIYHSIDESQTKEQNPPLHHTHRTKNNALELEEEMACLRRAIKVEKWMENYATNNSRRSRHVNSDSSSSTDSSLFSSSETESAPKSSSSTTPKTSLFHVLTKASHQTFEATPKSEGRFTRTKSRALKIYGDLKKVKQPISPGGKIANFLHSIFPSRNLKKNDGFEDWEDPPSSSVRKSRSVKDSSPPCSLSSRSCLMKRPVIPPPSSSRNKSKRSVRFCPVSVILDEDCQPCGQKSIYGEDYDPGQTPIPKINSHFLKKNMDSFMDYEEEKKSNKYGLRGFYEEDESDDDGKSCASSDLFELENIGIVGIGHGAHHREELPVYGTTNLKINLAIAHGLIV